MTLTLDHDRVVRLAGIEAPLGDDSWFPARAARAALSGLALDRHVTLRGSDDLDRWGRLVTQVERDDGVWLEGALLSAGEARVRTTLVHRELADPMLDLEADARAAKIGLWRSASFAPHTPDGLEHSSSRFELVEGVVQAVTPVRAGLMLGFAGGNLTALAGHSAARLFDESGQSLTSFIGHRIRLRGWVLWKGHPTIEIDHPEQIEPLD